MPQIMPELAFFTKFAALKFAACWAVAFLFMVLAVVLLNIYFGLIGNDLELRTAGKEAAIAGVASLVEAVGFWLTISFFQGAGHAMIFFAVVAVLIYKIAHYEDWSWNDVFILLAFQVVIAFVGVSLVFGHFGPAIFILAGFALFLALVAAFARSL